MIERSPDELFHREIDVAEIMQEIKKRALNMSRTDAVQTISGDACVSEQLAEIDSNLSRIASFIQNTLNESKSCIEMGAVIPVGPRWKGVFRKLIILFRRFVRKSTRYLVEDQTQFNQMSNQNIQALLEGQEQLKQALFQLQAGIQQNQQHYDKVSEQIGVVQQNVASTTATYRFYNDKLYNQLHAMAEQMHIYEKAYLKFQEEKQQNMIDEKLYKEYEDRYRGSEEDIKHRLSFYLPYIKDAVRNPTTEPILDLGCGRGEWMEFLQEHHYKVSGVDSNNVMVERCMEKGLQATCEDAITYLKRLPDCSVKVITGFQFAEHLKASHLEQLLVEAYRVLMFHGVLILEVPNCKNVEVGCSSFYSDPTHVRPVNSDYLEFIAQHKGFYEVQIAYWKQQEIDAWLDGVLSTEETKILESPTFRTVLASMKQTHYISPDYALIATK